MIVIASSIGRRFAVHVLSMHALLAYATFGAVPVTMPNPQMEGFTFPLSEATLTEQAAAMSRGDVAAARAVQLHAWGLWTAVTSVTTQRYERQPLRVFDTWTSLDDLLGAVSVRSEPSRPRSIASTARPHAFGQLRLSARAESEDALDEGEPILGAVKFDPTAAAHILQQRLLESSALNALLVSGAIQVPPFPATALVVKPVYKLIHARDLVAGRYYLLRVWTGPPPTPRPWGPDEWTAGVWIDLRNGGRGNGSVDPLPSSDGATRTEVTTYPVAQFMNHRLSAVDADAFNATTVDANASAGDTAILVAMHIAGRELARWTWQTFWWTPDAVRPPSPSSTEIAGARPPQLQGAPAHYAMALAYTMLAPNEPFTGGSNDAPAVYAYNPWIEAHFTPSDLPDSRTGFAPDGAPASNNTGVQTNCLSCHAQATFHPAGLATAPRFAGARYVDLGDPQFVGALQTDFLWVLARHAR